MADGDGALEKGFGEYRRAMTAEFVGTFALTFVVVAGTTLTGASGRPGEAATALAAGAIVLAMIYALGGVSGAHINPAVTLAFALRRAFPWRLLASYWAAQLGGGLAAALLAWPLLASVGPLRAPEPRIGLAGSAGMEVVLTALLVTVIIGTATDHRLVGPNAGIAVGFTVAACGAVGGPASGGSMNPALSLGPALVAGKLQVAWVYVAGPLLGAALGVALSWAIHGRPKRQERKTARAPHR